jgi:hypothetical protein
MIKLILTDDGYLDQEGNQVDIETYKEWYSIPYESNIYLFEKEQQYNQYLLIVKRRTQEIFEDTFRQLSDVK